MYVRDPTFHITHQPFYLGAKHLGIYGYQVTSCEAMRTPRQYISIGPLARLTEIRYVPLRVAVTRSLPLQQKYVPFCHFIKKKKKRVEKRQL